MNPQDYAARSAQPEEKIPVSTTTTRQYRDTQVDVKLVLCAVWIAMLFVFAYVDIFGFLRADVLNGRSTARWRPRDSRSTRHS